MAAGTEPATKLFHGVCPSCGTEGLEISGTDQDGRLNCLNCEWDSSMPAGGSKPFEKSSEKVLHHVG